MSREIAELRRDQDVIEGKYRQAEEEGYASKRNLQEYEKRYSICYTGSTSCISSSTDCKRLSTASRRKAKRRLFRVIVSSKRYPLPYLEPILRKVDREAEHHHPKAKLRSFRPAHKMDRRRFLAKKNQRGPFSFRGAVCRDLSLEGSREDAVGLDLGGKKGKRGGSFGLISIMISSSYA